MEKPKGTCQACGAQINWTTSRLDRHDHEGVRCEGSYKPPVEAVGAKSRKMTPAEARLSREMFGA